MSRFLLFMTILFAGQGCTGLSKKSKYVTIKRLELREEAEDESIIYWRCRRFNRQTDAEGYTPTTEETLSSASDHRKWRECSWRQRHNGKNL